MLLCSECDDMALKHLKRFFGTKLLGVTRQRLPAGRS